MASQPSDLNALGMVASLSSSYLSFASAIITAAMWPIAVLVIVWVFRPHIVSLLPSLERLDLFGAKFELKRQLDQADKDSVTASTTAPPAALHDVAATDAPDDESDTRNLAEGLSVEEAVTTLRNDPSAVTPLVLQTIAEQDAPVKPGRPALSIIQAWAVVQRSAFEAAVAAGFEHRLDTRRVAVKLAEKGYATSHLLSLLVDLERIHERVIRSPIAADVSDAIRFASLADRAIELLKEAKMLANSMRSVQASQADRPGN
ncbi:MAG: hypothetical protein WC563_02740 [Brevundimonas sp.]|jgi:hypothetical protein